MREFLRETIIDDVNNGHFQLTETDLVQIPVSHFSVCRNEELDLIFENTSRGLIQDRPDRYPAGTVRSVNEMIEFRHPAGWAASARGMIERGIRSSTDASGQIETFQTFSAYSIELDLRRQIDASYVVEWI